MQRPAVGAAEHEVVIFDGVAMGGLLDTSGALDCIPREVNDASAVAASSPLIQPSRRQWR